MGILGGLAVGAGVSVANKLLGGGEGKKTKQEPLETPEQAEAKRRLLEFSKTGKHGDFTAGEEVDLGFGDFDPTAIETQGLSSLQRLLSSGMPEQYKLGDDALRDLLETSPGAIDAQFEPFKAKTTRALSDAEDAYKRGSAFSGNLYSTDTMRGLGDIQTRGHETLTGKLAELTNAALDRRLQAIPLAYQSAGAQEDTALNRVVASQQLGGLTRQLNDQSIKARDAEILRRRSELGMPIDALSAVAGQNTNFGVKEITTPQDSPYQGLLDLASNLGGQYLGNEIWKHQYKDYLPKTKTA